MSPVESKILPQANYLETGMCPERAALVRHQVPGRRGGPDALVPLRVLHGEAAARGRGRGQGHHHLPGRFAPQARRAEGHSEVQRVPGRARPAAAPNGPDHQPGLVRLLFAGVL